MSYTMPLWYYLEKRAAAKTEERRPPQGSDYLTDRRPEPVVDWAGRKIRRKP